MNIKVQVKEVIIDVGDKQITITYENAKSLYYGLKNIFDKNITYYNYHDNLYIY